MCVRWTGVSGCSRCRAAAGAGSPSRLMACHPPRRARQTSPPAASASPHPTHATP
jgi:hypothetical protein